ncbi:hypothetical protein C1645_817489 [Glomus cerebriforme]|uniref:Uncharacterized protein n=1 Tax=Glomus cerebriforme TaxID=658196 RepID=A0A397TIG4_9GLOM|nr:hypothetical protein C1645_817489 [Glomus cerebriforme]
MTLKHSTPLHGNDNVFILIFTILFLSIPFVLSSENNPYFDPNIPSCVQCEKEYPSIDSCTKSCEIFQNASLALFDPQQIIDSIRCACTDTFLSVYPLCIECFRRTGQSNTLLNTEVPPAVDTIRSVCQTTSAIAGNASSYDATATATPLSPTDYPNSANSRDNFIVLISTILLLLLQCLN